MEYNLDGVTYVVEIVRKNNKNSYVRVKEGGVIYVTTSFFITKKQIIHLLDANQHFLRKALSKQKQKEEQDEKIYYLGNKYNLIISNMFLNIEIDGNKIYARSKKEFDNWYKKEAERIFDERYRYQYQRFEERIPFFTLKLRNMKTRWGVCNRRSKTITLNTRLIKYPLCCLDYVIVHELSHLIEFNHSSNFWKVVEKYYQDYKKVRNILKD